MPFKHQVTDSRGKIHQRISAERQYHFAVVIHFKAFIMHATGREWPAHSKANWSTTYKLAQASTRRYRNAHSLDSFEIIPCTPIATGKHAQPV